MLPANRPLPGKRAGAVHIPPKEKRGSRKRWIALAVVVLLLVGIGTAWASGMFDGRDPRLDEIGDMWAKMKDVPEKDRFARMMEIGKKVSELPPELQQKLQEEAMKRAPQMMNGPNFNELLALPADKRTAAIDKQLDRMVAMQKQFEQMQKNAPPGAGGPRGPMMMGGGGPGGGNQNAGRNRMLSQIPAGSKAAVTIWFQLMQARANERGITMPWR